MAFATKLGPGTLTLGPVGTPMDASCQLANAVVQWDKDVEDDITVLCGDVVPGGATYSAALAGSFLQDLSEEDGLVAYTWENKGTVVDFEFVPNTAAGATVTGQVTIDPLDIGSTEDYGAVLTSDFEWACVGEPAVAWGGVTRDAESSSRESEDVLV
jgi:hypothetical protein